MMIDASHANSSKKPENQPLVVADIARQVAGGEQRVVGVMIESNLVAGRQDVRPGAALTYGQSITDGCIDWQTTVPALNLLADAVAARRERAAQPIPGAFGVADTSARHWPPILTRPAAAADALDLAIEDGVLLAQRIVRIVQVLRRGHVAGARLAVADRRLWSGWLFTAVDDPPRCRFVRWLPGRRSGPATPPM